MESIYTLALAYIGGILLNLMPCILPILVIKINIITRTGENYKKALVATILGIFSVFLLASFASMTLKLIGHSIGLGLGFQIPEFIIIICIVFTILISIALNGFNMPLPNTLLGMSENAKGYLSSFIDGVVISILSLPCTAPFLGFAIAVAMNTSASMNVMIFLATALGFSMPYLLLLIYKDISCIFPKSGQWQIYLNKLMAVILIAVTIWLIFILSDQLGYRAAIGFFLLLILIKFILEEPKIKGIYKMLILCMLIICSLYLPRSAYEEDNSYQNYSQSIWSEFKPDKIDNLLENNKVVLVHYTASWCLTCKINDLRVWRRGNVIEFIKANNVLSMKKDVTKKDELAEKFAKDHEIYGVPFDIVFGPSAKSGIKLSPLLSQEDVINAIKSAK